MSSEKRVPLEEQKQVTVTFAGPHFFRGEFYDKDDTVVTGENAAKKLLKAGHKATREA